MFTLYPIYIDIFEQMTSNSRVLPEVTSVKTVYEVTNVLESINLSEKMDSSILCRDNDKIRDRKVAMTRRFGNINVLDTRGQKVCNKVLNTSNPEKSLNLNPRSEGTRVPQEWVVIINQNGIIEIKDTPNPTYQCIVGMTHLMDNLKNNNWHSQVVRGDAQVLSRQTVLQLVTITYQNIRSHVVYNATVDIVNIEVSAMKHARSEGTQDPSWQSSHLIFAISEGTQKPQEQPSNLLARTGITRLLDTHCPEAQTKIKVTKSLQNVGFEGTHYPGRRPLDLQAHIEIISAPLMLITEQVSESRMDDPNQGTIEEHITFGQPSKRLNDKNNECLKRYLNAILVNYWSKNPLSL